MVKNGVIPISGNGEKMDSNFNQPDFHQHDIELRYVNGEICIYATENGLRNIISTCEKLIKDSKVSHIHLEDYDMLTADSLKGVIAIFEK